MAIIDTPAASWRMRAQRGTVLLIASLMLHLIIFNWASGRLGFPSLHEAPVQAITTIMLPAPPPKPAPLQRPAVPKPQARPKRPPAPPPAPAPMAEPVIDAASPLSPDAGASIDGDAGPPAGDAVAPAAPANDSAAEQAAAPEEKVARYKVSPPPSAALQYDVHAVRNGQNWYGSGAFNWQATDSGYRISGEASITILFKIGVLNFTSEGALTDTGIAPVLYSEKPWRKAMTNTHFRHAEQTISFSASEATYPYSSGAQDRASIIWQLAGIGRGDVAQFAPGTEIDIFVAGTRSAETWRIRVIGEEEIDTPYGRLAAWHVVRAPRAGTHDQQIDIWLAPQQQWYPARVRYTYANGDHLDMSLSGIAGAQ